jgi:hypothetical protein
MELAGGTGATMSERAVYDYYDGYTGVEVDLDTLTVEELRGMIRGAHYNAVRVTSEDGKHSFLELADLDAIVGARTPSPWPKDLVLPWE